MSNMSSLHVFAHTVPSAWKVTASMVFHQQHTCSPSESQLKYDLSWRSLQGAPQVILLTELGLASLSHCVLTSSGSLPWRLLRLFPYFLTRAWVLWKKKCTFIQFCSFITRLTSWLINARWGNINGGGGFKKWAGNRIKLGEGHILSCPQFLEKVLTQTRRGVKGTFQVLIKA